MEKIDKIANLAELKAFLLQDGVTIGLHALSALLIFLTGWWLAKFVRLVLRRFLARVRMDASVAAFLASLVYVALLIFTLVAVVDQLGVATTSIITALGAAGLAIGLALQGSLSNFASGVLIVLLRPFHAGNFIQTGAISGSVVEIGIFFTVLKTADNRRVFLPNSVLMNAAIINFSSEPVRKIELAFTITTESSAEQACAILGEITKADARILTAPAPEIGITNLGANGVELCCRPWVKAGDFGNVSFDLLARIKARFDAAGVILSRPFPQPKADAV